MFSIKYVKVNACFKKKNIKTEKNNNKSTWETGRWSSVSLLPV